MGPSLVVDWPSQSGSGIGVNGVRWVGAAGWGGWGVAAECGGSLQQLVLQVVATMRVTSCGRCGARFTPEGGTTDLCPVCAFRRANPFGTQMPRMTDVTRDR
ncbi:hypothetical protein GCM10027418_26760 [Mariniluteicoccus endophyticus]